MQRVDDVFTSLLVLHQPGVSQHAQVMRDVDQLAAQQFGQLSDVLWTGLQALNDLQTVRLAERLEIAGADVGLQLIVHGIFQAYCWTGYSGHYMMGIAMCMETAPA